MRATSKPISMKKVCNSRGRCLTQSSYLSMFADGFKETTIGSWINWPKSNNSAFLMKNYSNQLKARVQSKIMAYNRQCARNVTTFPSRWTCWDENSWCHKIAKSTRECWMTSDWCRMTYKSVSFQFNKTNSLSTSSIWTATKNNLKSVNTYTPRVTYELSVQKRKKTAIETRISTISRNAILKESRQSLMMLQCQLLWQRRAANTHWPNLILFKRNQCLALV